MAKHPFVEMTGLSQKDFDKKYPTEEHFFSSYPHMRNAIPKRSGSVLPKKLIGGSGNTQIQGDFVTPNSKLAGNTVGTSGKISEGVRPYGSNPPILAPVQTPVNPVNSMAGLFAGVTPAANQSQSIRRDNPSPFPLTGEQGYNNDNSPAAPIPGASTKNDPYGCEDSLGSFKTGGFTEKPGYHFDGQKMVKSKGSGTYSNGVYFEVGGHVYTEKEMKEVPHYQLGGGTPYNNEDVDVPEFALGGIHIKKSHVGKFNDYKKRTGKTTQEALHSKDPHVRAMAQFAINSAKWKKEYGGTANPFHPLKEFQVGGDTDDDPMGEKKSNTNTINDIGNEGRSPEDAYADAQGPAYIPPTQQTNVDGSPKQDNGPVNIPNDPDRGDNTWRQGMTDQDANTQLQQSQLQQSQQRQRGYGNNFLGAGIAVGSALGQYEQNKHEAEHNIARTSGDRATMIVNASGHGRQNSQGYDIGTYSQTPGVARNGGKFQTGGQYTKGSVVELSEEEINDMIRKGYKLAKV